MRTPRNRHPIFDRLSRYLHSRLIRKLALMMVIIGSLPALLVYGTMYSVSTNQIQLEVRKNSQDSLKNIHSDVQDVLQTAEHVAMGLSIDDNFTSKLAEDNLAVGSLNRSTLRNLLESNLKTNRSVLNAIHIESLKNTVYAYNIADPVSPYNIRIFGSEYEEAVLAKKGALYWFSLTDSTFPQELQEARREYLRCAMAVYDTGSRECLGIVSIFVRTSALEDCLAGPWELAQEETVLLLDSENRRIVSSRPVSPELEEALQDTALSQEGSTISLRGREYLLSFMECSTTGWRLVSLIPRSAVTQELRPRAVLLLPLLLIPIACLLVSIFFMRWLLRTFTPLLRTMHEIQGGDLTVRAPEVEDSALDIIGQTLNNTLDKYQELVEVTGHQEALLTISRLKFLRSQLSPHFLYNTLDSVNWMLLDAGQFETSQIISDLGFILRYSLDETKDTVPLHEEIHVIQRYLSIVRNRFENRLRCAISVDPELADYPIPRFLLQPIVENAVVHGVERTAANSTLTIRCYVAEDTVRIDIANDGPSIPAETRRQLLESFRQPEEASTHIGLRNVYERIRLRFGSAYGLDILDLEPRGAMIRLRLPPEPPKEGGNTP